MEKKKRNRGRNLLILVVILAVCCVGYVILRQTAGGEEAEETEEEEETEDLLSLAEVVSLSYVREGEEIGLFYSEDGECWQRSGWEDFPVDSQTVSSMVSDLTGAKILRVIAQDGLDLDEYGLESPAYTVTVQDSEGESAVLYIGDENALAGGTYVQIDGEDRILMTDEVLATAFNYGWYDLASVDESPYIDDSEVNTLEVIQGENSFSFVYEAEGMPEVDATGSEKLFLVTENGVQAISSDWEEDILDAVQDFSYTDLAAYRPDEEERAAFGLDEPSAVITVQYTTTEEAESGDDEEDGEEAEPETITEEHTYVLTVGAFDEETDHYYVQHDDSSSIFTMSADLLENLLNLDAAQMRPLNPAAVEADSVESFEVTAEGITRTYAVETETAAGTDEETGETEEDEEEEPETTASYTLDGESIEESEYETALGAVTGLDGVRLLMDGEAVETDAEITIVFHRTVEEYPTVTIELFPYNENYYQLAQNGGEPYMVVDIGTVESLKQVLSLG